MHVQSLTLEGCFHLHLLKGESLSVLTLDITTSLEAKVQLKQFVELFLWGKKTNC